MFVSFQIEMHVRLEFVERHRLSKLAVLRENPVKLLKSIINRITYDAFDSASDALSHVL